MQDTNTRGPEWLDHPGVQNPKSNERFIAWEKRDTNSIFGPESEWIRDMLPALECGIRTVVGMGDSPDFDPWYPTGPASATSNTNKEHSTCGSSS